MNEEQQEPRPGYYGILPASVRYHPDLSMGAKVMYTEFAALCNKEGYCWASNAYFAKLYNMTPGSISEWVGSLKRAGFITVELFPEKGNVRRVTLRENPHRSTEKTVEGSTEKTDSYKESITRVNTKKNKGASSAQAKQFQKPSIEEIAAYGTELGLPNPECIAFYDHHEARGWMLGRVKMKDWRAALRTWRHNAAKFERKPGPVKKQTPISKDSFWHGEIEALIREWRGGERDLAYLVRKLTKAGEYVDAAEVWDFIRGRMENQGEFAALEQFLSGLPGEGK